MFWSLKVKGFSLLLALLLIPLSSNAEGADSFFSESFGDYQEELAVAADEDKKGVFMFYYMDDCPFCQRMESTVMTEPDVIELYRSHFLTLKHDIEGSHMITDFDGESATAQTLAEKKYRVRATPVMIIFDLQGKPIVRFTGPTRTKTEFKWLAQYVIEEAYKTQNFTVYKRAKKREQRE